MISIKKWVKALRDLCAPAYAQMLVKVKNDDFIKPNEGLDKLCRELETRNVSLKQLSILREGLEYINLCLFL